MSTLKTKIILLKELLALKEVVDKGSIQIASYENGIKNSNLSQLVKDLENRFNTKLINRKFDGSQPTNSTQLIYNDICAIEELLNKFWKPLWIWMPCLDLCLFGPKKVYSAVIL